MSAPFEEPVEYHPPFPSKKQAIEPAIRATKQISQKDIQRCHVSGTEPC